MKMNRIDKMLDICLKAIYRSPEGPMKDIYHEALMASVEKELIEHTPDCNMITGDIERIRLAYCRLCQDLTKIKEAYSDEDEG